ncbi:hypothetical protein [Actinomadura sp. 9N407]|uniref:hypothetical protein n=1 Tax=Actinomadura sp. 9N407 TaxID=3375154 RepID=UPI0037AA7B74
MSFRKMAVLPFPHVRERNPAVMELHDAFTIEELQYVRPWVCAGKSQDGLQTAGSASAAKSW